MYLEYHALMNCYLTIDDLIKLCFADLYEKVHFKIKVSTELV